MSFLFPPIRQTAGFGSRPLTSGGGPLKVVTFRLTNAQFNNISTTPAVIVVNGGTNIIVPVFGYYRVVVTVAYGAAPVFRWRLVGITARELLSTSTPSLASVQQVTMMTQPPSAEYQGVALNPVGLSVQFDADINPSLGAGTISSFVGQFGYMVVPSV